MRRTPARAADGPRRHGGGGLASSPAASVRAVAAGEEAGHGLQVEPDAEMGTARRDDHGPDGGVGASSAMATGRSSQKAGPMALRASGRSSHRVATGRRARC